MNENNNIEENKIIEDNKPVEEKKSLDKKKLTKRIINGVIVLGAVILFSIGFLFSNVIMKKNDINYVESHKTLSREDFIAIVNMYGDAATKATKQYMKDNNNEVPSFELVRNLFIMPSYSVSCSDSKVNYDGSIYLSNCTIKGYSSHYDYKYGQDLEENTSSDDSSDTANGRTYYIFKETNNDGFTLVSSLFKDYDTRLSSTERNLKIEFIEAYTCKSATCSIGAVSPDNSSLIKIVDENIFYTYNPFTKEKKSYPNIKVSEDMHTSDYANLIADTKGNVNYACVTNDSKIAFYNLNTSSFITDFIKGANTTGPYLMDRYLFAYSTFDENQNRSVYLLNALDGSLYKKIDGFSSISGRKIGGKIYFFGYSHFDGQTSVAEYGQFLNVDFERVINGNKDYFYVINSDNSVTIHEHNGNKFTTYDFNFKEVFDSSTYTKLSSVIKDYVVVRANNEVLILDQYGKTISKFFDFNNNYEDLYCFTSGDNQYIYYYFKDKTKNNETYRYTYNFSSKGINLEKAN